MELLELLKEVQPKLKLGTPCVICGNGGQTCCFECGAHVCLTCFMGRIYDNRCPVCDKQTMY